jgi:hypothetical protein
MDITVGDDFLVVSDTKNYQRRNIEKRHEGNKIFLYRMFL